MTTYHLRRIAHQASKCMPPTPIAILQPFLKRDRRLDLRQSDSLEPLIPFHPLPSLGFRIQNLPIDEGCRAIRVGLAELSVVLCVERSGAGGLGGRPPDRRLELPHGTAWVRWRSSVLKGCTTSSRLSASLGRCENDGEGRGTYAT